MVLTQEEIDGCREAFLAFDKDRSGTIDVSPATARQLQLNSFIPNSTFLFLRTSLSYSVHYPPPTHFPRHFPTLIQLSVKMEKFYYFVIQKKLIDLSKLKLIKM